MMQGMHQIKCSLWMLCTEHCVLAGWLHSSQPRGRMAVAVLFAVAKHRKRRATVINDRHLS
jgi:hypothetical protein